MLHRFNFARFLTLCLFCITCALPVAYADTLTIPNSFTAGTPAQASQVNSNFNAVAAIVNGNIANDNIKSAAAIALSKIDLTSAAAPTNEWFVKRAASNRCLSAGTTGDTVPRVSLSSDGYLQFGPGGASALDIGMRRFSGSAVQFFSGAAPTGSGANVTASSFYTRATLADANPSCDLGNGILMLGPGGVTLADAGIRRQSAGVARIVAADTTTRADLELANLDVTGNVTANTLIPACTPGGRLCLTSNTPVTGDVTGAGTLYYTPYINNVYPAYTTASGKYTAKNFTEASLSLSISSGTNYDVFGVYTSGTTPTLSTVAWASDTARNTNLTRSTISGLLYKTGDEESLYLGTIRGSGSNVTAKSRAAGQLYVWNMYNRVVEDALAQDTTDSWNYTTVAFQEARAQSTEGVSRIGIVRGQDDDVVRVTDVAGSSNSSASITRANGIGIDSSTVNSGHSVLADNAASRPLMQTATYSGRPGIGYHTLRRLEASGAATGTCTWYGDNGGTIMQTGMRLSQPM